MAKFYGFTLLRNGCKYDYSFKECLLSLTPLCEKIYLALGDSEDDTEAELEAVPGLEIVPTVWDMSKREGGLILSEQTNIALAAARKYHQEETGSWGFYLQCDEVLHEDDQELILQDLQMAEAGGYDAMTFRYFHFWQRHHIIAINKKWYPQEIRAVKLDTPIESWGDAQSFRHHKKVYHSDARIFHYGHVREEDSYQEKKKDILKLYHSDEKIGKYKRREKKFDNQTECLTYLGPHPKVMKDRIERLGDSFQASLKEEVYIIDPMNQVTEEMRKKVRAREVIVLESLGFFNSEIRKKAVVLYPHIFDQLRGIKKIPEKMRSPLAREWDFETRLILALSQCGVGYDSN